MKLLKWLSFLFRRNVKVKSVRHYLRKSTPYFYSESIDCLESLLSDNCCEWGCGANYYRVYKSGIDKLKEEPDEVFHDTYVYKGRNRQEALLKAIKALQTKNDFKNKKKLRIPKAFYV